jgi:hypothetical protein
MSFGHLLSIADRRRLREVVRKVHLKFLPQHMLTNRECDRVIEAFGPETVERYLREVRARGD